VRSPLLPLLRVGAVLSVSVVLLYCQRRRPPESTADIFWAVDINETGSGFLRVGEKVVGPLPGQKKPPCVPRVERELVGACWQPHLERPPCPPGFFDGDGMCLQPVLASKRPSTSIQP